MPLAQLLSPAQLADQLHSADLLLLDCRFALEDRQYGANAYAQGHLPGAHFLDLEEDLSAPAIAGKTGRHPLPDPGKLHQRLTALGLTAHSRVVMYDDGPGCFAARAWWLLIWLGLRDNLYLLDGGLSAWRNAGLALSQDPPRSTAGHLPATTGLAPTISATQLLERLDDPALTLLDARSLPRFSGASEPIDPVAGHIPGALCAPFTDNLGADGRFRPAGELRERFAALLGQRAAEQLVAYCGSGVTACHNLFALCLAGYPLATLYPGSWSEWITVAERPVARDA